MITPFLDPTVITAASGLIALVVIAAALLHGWNGWLDLKRRELDHAAPPPAASDEGLRLGSARIELADLKERIRKLEAIASGVEL
jgi:IS5 family transposase